VAAALDPVALMIDQPPLRDADTRAIELFSAVSAGWWAVLLLVLSAERIALAPSYQAVRALAPEGWLGVLFGLVGLAQAGAVLWDWPCRRVVLALIAVHLWAVVAIALLVNYPPSPAGGLYAALSLACAWVTSQGPSR